MNLYIYNMFCKQSATIFNSVAAMVYGLKIRVGDDVTLSWPPPDPPHGVILFYNIKITNQNTMNTTVLTGYTQTSIPKSALTQSVNVSNGAVIAVQVLHINNMQA